MIRLAHSLLICIMISFDYSFPQEKLVVQIIHIHNAERNAERRDGQNIKRH